MDLRPLAKSFLLLSIGLIMDFQEKKYLKTFTPKRNMLYYHPNPCESDYWSCCGLSVKCYKGKRGCRFIASIWVDRRALIVLYEKQKEVPQKQYARLPLALLKEVVLYI